MAAPQPSNKESSGGYAVPLGWAAFLGGLLGIAGSVLIRLGLLPKTDYPVGVLGIALFVGGYIACFVIPPLHRRISALEERVNNIDNDRADAGTPSGAER